MFLLKYKLQIKFIKFENYFKLQSNLGYPNADYPKLLGYSKNFEVIRLFRLKKLLLNYPSRFEVQKSLMVIMISLFGRVLFTHLSDLANKVATGN